MSVGKLSKYDEPVKKTVNDVLKIEREYRHIENLTQSLKKEICEKIIRLIEREVK